MFFSAGVSRLDFDRDLTRQIVMVDKTASITIADADIKCHCVRNLAFVTRREQHQYHTSVLSRLIRSISLFVLGPLGRSLTCPSQFA
eukprot:3802791-Pyramimonas_sp.AAC.1